MNLIKKINDAKTIWQILPELSINDLEKVISLANDSYYNSNISLITDHTYDILITRLQLLNPKSNIFGRIGAEIKGKKVKLPYFLGSMNKIKTEEKLIDKWVKIFKGPYIISDKLDGISCLMTFDPDESSREKIKMYTRGDGRYGQNISHLLGMINASIDKLVKLDIKISIRGELIMSKKNFENYKDEMSNGRSMVAGIVNSKKDSVNAEYASNVDFVTYEVIEPYVKPSEQMEMLKKWKLNTVHYDIYNDIDLNILDSILQKRKKKSVYEIDGVIVTDDMKHKREDANNPIYSFAYKGLTETADTKVIEVLWKPSKDGILVPKIHYKKVRLSQANLEYTTGFNAKYIVDNKIGPSAIITIVRSGDVIPYIMHIVEPAKKPSLPNVDYYWDKNKVNIILSDADENEVVVIQRLTKFAKYIGIENLSEGLVTRLVNTGYNTILKIISLTVDDLLLVEGFRETLANKLYLNIQNALKNLDLLTLMAASNIFGRGFGKRKIKKILDYYPNIVDEYNKKKHQSWNQKLLSLEGFDTISVDHFLDALPEFQKFHDKIEELVNIKPHSNVVKKNGIFKDQKVTFTGFRIGEWQKFIESEGGNVSGSVSRNTTLLVYNDGEESSAKYQTAKKLGIKTLSKTEFAKKYSLIIPDKN